MRQHEHAQRPRTPSGGPPGGREGLAVKDAQRAWIIVCAYWFVTI